MASGYVAWGTSGSDKDADPWFTTWFSPDGRTWIRTVHAKSIVPCPGWTARADLESVYAPASDGRTLVFTATYLMPDTEACDRAAMISLTTTNGRTWARSRPFARATGTPAWAVWAESAWAIPEGWETLVSAGDAKTIWRSTDLVTWTSISSQPTRDEPVLDFRVLGAAPDGTRLAVRTEQVGEAHRTTLLSSNDSVTWIPRRSLPSGFGVVDVAAPSAAGRPWVIPIGRDDGAGAQVLVSPDLVHWDQVPFPEPQVGAIEALGPRWMAVGSWVSGGSVRLVRRSTQTCPTRQRTDCRGSRARAASHRAGRTSWEPMALVASWRQGTHPTPAE